MKIGIVSPYAYPRPGGANDNIRETYENLRGRGHDVRIITAPWGDDPPAQDVIQIGQAIAVPYNGSVGRITLYGHFKTRAELVDATRAIATAGQAVVIAGGTVVIAICGLAVAGIPIICAVSAPSDLAIETAERLGATLVGFLRGDGFNVYAHDARIDLRDLSGLG